MIAFAMRGCAVARPALCWSAPVSFSVTGPSRKSVSRSTRAGSAFHALEVARGVEGCLVALQCPERLGEAFHDAVLGLVRVAGGLHQAAIEPPDARRLIDAQLLEDGEVQAHVQEWIGFALLGEIVTLQGLLGLRHETVILGVSVQDLDDLSLDRLQGLPGLGLQPSGDEGATMAFTVVCEHGVEDLDGVQGIRARYSL